jgi:S1-C subfamily serine protease
MQRRIPLVAALGLIFLGARASAEPGHERPLERTLLRLAEYATPRTAVVYGAIGLGSGAVVDREGTVVTNAHVGLLARVATIEFADGRRFTARRRGIDLERDLAIYEPETKLTAPAPFFELGHGRPAVGSWLVGAGFPGGPRGDLRPTISCGQATAGGGLESRVMGMLRYDEAIRTDLAIFSGNSGGPLLDLDGDLVGINGAIEPASGAAFAVPVELVADRLETLKNGAIRLPGGRMLDAKNPAIAAIDRIMEPLARQLTERVREGFSPEPGGSRVPLEKRASGVLPPSRDDLARVLKAAPRSVALAAELHAAALAAKDVAVSIGGHFATRIDARHLVAKTSLLGEGREFALGAHTRARVVAVAPEHDLTLLELDADADVRLPEDAPSRPAGSLVAALGPDGLLAAGIVSVGPRAIPEAVSMRISGGAESPLLKPLREVAKIAERLGSKDLSQLIEGLLRGLELQGQLNLGNEPRGYARVLSHDAGLAPSEAGAPLVDADGRLVGVNVANANYGTSYAVPIATVRAAFAAQLGAARVPSRLGRARLY